MFQIIRIVSTIWKLEELTCVDYQITVFVIRIDVIGCNDGFYLLRNFHKRIRENDLLTIVLLFLTIDLLHVESYDI